MRPDKIRDDYLSDAERFRKEESKEEKILLIISVLRLVIFAGGITLIWLGFLAGTLPGILLSVSFTVLFLWLLKLNASHSAKRKFLGNIALLNENEAKALTGDLEYFDAGTKYCDPHHSFAGDVDLFGHGSLYQYLNRTVTGQGSDILASWLADPFPLSEKLRQRQEAVKETAGKKSWRHRFIASGMNTGLDRQSVNSLIEWMNQPDIIRSSLPRRILIYLLPCLAVAFIVLALTGLAHYGYSVALFLSNLLYVASGLRRTNNIHSVVSGKHNFLAETHRLMTTFENESFTSQLLSETKQALTGEKISASASVKNLGRLIRSFDSRLNMIAAFILNGLLLWDYHCIYRLERWKARYKGSLPLWLDSVGQVDALISLGNFAYNNPDFTFPVTAGSDVLFSFRAVGHPLIDEKRRVCNDLVFRPPLQVCIITGANMSGKSTFLRTVAVNYILAMTGSPVCAEEMVFTPVRLFTSMRTTDSLSENESYFYAELKRLKLLRSEIERGGGLLFILDEILKGTNSADKTLGSKLFIEKIVELGGTGLVATHDISLGELELVFPGRVNNKCFEVDIDGEEIRFDYRLMDGVTKKMNAAFLMKQMGLLG